MFSGVVLGFEEFFGDLLDLLEELGVFVFDLLDCLGFLFCLGFFGGLEDCDVGGVVYYC